MTNKIIIALVVFLSCWAVAKGWSKEYKYITIPDKPFYRPEYFCPIHGEQETYFVVFAKDETYYFCIECFGAFISNNIGKMTKIKE